MEKYISTIKNPKDANNRFFNFGVSLSMRASSAACMLPEGPAFAPELTLLEPEAPFSLAP
jgi:hypothetical protein